MCDNTSTGRVFFVGAGPGAGDLITVRGARLISKAHVVVWPSGVVPTEVVREHAGAAAELVDAARLPDEVLMRLYRRAAAERLTVVRLLPGDAAVWAGLQAHYDACRRLGLRVEIVPGVSPLSAVVAATGHELTDPAVLVTQFDDARPERLAGAPGAAVAVTASSSRTEALVAQLRAGGRADDTPVVVAIKPSRPDELVLTTTLGELDLAVKQHRLWLPALFLVGPSASPAPASARTAAAPVAVPAAVGARGSAVTTRTPVGSGGASSGSGGAWSGSGGAPGSGGASGSGGVSGSGAGASAVARDPLHRSYRRRRRTSTGGVT